MQKKIQIGGKKYTLTANMSIIKTLYSIAPEMLALNNGKNEPNKAKVGVEIMANLDKIFYDMIRVAHKDISKETSDGILDKFEDEYEDVQNEILNLAMSVFTTGDQKKKKIIWED